MNPIIPTVLYHGARPLSTDCKDALGKTHTWLAERNIKLVSVWVVLDQLGTKALVATAVKPIADVYLIINLVNGKHYFGSKLTGKVGQLFYKHLWGFSGSVAVAATVCKYGLSNFAFVLLEVFPPTMDEESKLYLWSWDNWYLALLELTYNIAPTAGTNIGFKHIAATKQLMSANYSDKRRETIEQLNRGKTLSTETQAKLPLAAFARGPMSDESRALVFANSAKAELYAVSLLDGSQSVVLRTVFAVTVHCSCNTQTVSRALAGSGIINNNWIIKCFGKANVKS